MEELLPFLDILKVFNNPINEEQAWAVCYQCANFLSRNQHQEYYQVVCDSGIHSIWLNRHGDVVLRKGPPDPNGSGKGPPTDHDGPESPQRFTLPGRRSHVLPTETDAVSALGTVIFQTLDYGIEDTEERQLSSGLEGLIMTMTSADMSMDLGGEEQGTADDEGIEKDADLDTRCTVMDVLKLCRGHLSSKQDASHHYKAVCRALATEAGELFTFLDKISSGREKLSENADDESKHLEELRRADWACLWVQVMRSLRSGVLLKKIEHVHQPHLEYELTPFETILEDIRSRRYSLHKIMQEGGEIPKQTKDSAHAVILDFIRSRPPLRKANERKLKPKPASPPDPHQRLLNDIKTQPKLRPVKDGRLIVQSKKRSSSSTSSYDSEDDCTDKVMVKKVIKPDFNLLLNNSFELSFWESSSEEDHSDISQGSPMSQSPHSQPRSWQRAVTRENLISGQDRSSRLQRRHSIAACDSPQELKVSQELPILEEEEEPSPVRESHCLTTAPRRRPLVRAASETDILAQKVKMRHPPQGHGVRRSNAEHRRSLTSLTAIPELDDQTPGGVDVPGRSASAHMQRWSHEMAPPPNPSPPAKGRKPHGMSGISGMKPNDGPFHPLSRSQSARTASTSSNFSGMPPQNVNSFSSGNANPSRGSSLSSPRRNSAHSLSQHAPSSQTFPSASSSGVNSSSLRRQASLDLNVSSQSPVFFRKTKILHKEIEENTSPSPESSSDQDTRGVARWRNPKAREERLMKQRQPRDQQSQSPINEGDEVFDNALPSHTPHKELSHSEAERLRRLSLDHGVRRYHDPSNRVSQDPASRVSMPLNEVTSTKINRRLSLGTRERRGTHQSQRLPEEEERVTRWRALQEEDLASRRKPRMSRSLHTDLSKSNGDFAEHMDLDADEPVEFKRKIFAPQQRRGGLKKAVSVPSHLPCEETDVLQQKLSSEEARFVRWRQLEEGGGVLDDMSEATSSSTMEGSDYESAQTSLASDSHTSFLSQTAGDPGTFMGTSPLAKRWQNPVECLSLTLEEVTHIRSVLTKAELESLLSHPDLYQQVSKNKLCFTCKTTRFSLFGEWGTKCKFCKRTVCSKCLRKMNVPSDQFRNIPVYTLSPAPLTPQMQEFVNTFINSTPASSVPPTRAASPSRAPPSPRGAEGTTTSAPSHSTSRTSKPLQRSLSAITPSQYKPPPVGLTRAASIKGPLLAICCDCKGMVMEIIRASRASIAVLSASHMAGAGATHGGLMAASPPSRTAPSLNASRQSLF